ncbi:MAG: HD domain-containing protein [Alphaproteobacteria bacterium]
MSIVAVTQALHFAALKHVAQRRKGAAAEPYVNHLIEVTHLLAEATCGGDAALLVAGALHDVVEDQGVTFAELTHLFGLDAGTLVMEVTDDKNLPKAERKRLQIAHSGGASARAKCIKLADKISNLRAVVASPPKDWPRERLADYVGWARAVAEQCLGVNERLDEVFGATLAAAEALHVCAADDGKGVSA